MPDVRLHVAAEKTAVVLPRLHHHGEIAKLSGAFVEVKPVEILFHNQPDRFPHGIAVGFINLHQHVKKIAQNMPRTHAGVDDADVFRFQRGVFPADFRKLRRDLRLLLRFVEIIFPTGFQFVIRMSFQPQPTEGVLHHVAHNPVGREKLRGGGNFFLLDFFSRFAPEYFVLRLGVVILVQPADDLNLIRPVFFGNQFHHLLNDAALAEQEIRQQQFRVIVNFLEQSGENFIQGVALGNEKILEEILSPIRFFQRVHDFPVQPVKFQMNRLSQHLRLEFALVIREHAHMGRQVAVDLHKPKRGKAVEPSESHFFHDDLIPLRVHLADERLTLTLFRHGQ